MAAWSPMTGSASTSPTSWTARSSGRRWSRRRHWAPPTSPGSPSGVYPSMAAISRRWRADGRFEPKLDAARPGRPASTAGPEAVARVRRTAGMSRQPAMTAGAGRDRGPGPAPGLRHHRGPGPAVRGDAADHSPRHQRARRRGHSAALPRRCGPAVQRPEHRLFQPPGAASRGQAADRPGGGPSHPGPRLALDQYRHDQRGDRQGADAPRGAERDHQQPQRRQHHGRERGRSR
jgi:hypothetical protein